MRRLPGTGLREIAPNRISRHQPGTFRWARARNLPMDVAKRSAYVCLAGFAVANLGAAPRSPQKGKVEYARVDAIFRKYDCVACHNDGPNSAMGLHLTSRSNVLQGSSSGPVIVPRDPNSSRIIAMVRGTGSKRMPPQGHPLGPNEIQILSDWIQEGCQPDRYSVALDAFDEAGKRHDTKSQIRAAEQLGRIRVAGVNTKDYAATMELPCFTTLKDEKGWYGAAKRVVKIRPAKANVLNNIAWDIVGPQSGWKHRDLALGRRAALLAVADSHRKSGAILDTLAWVYCRQGDRPSAVATMQEALKCSDASAEPLKKALQDDLALFSLKP